MKVFSEKGYANTTMTDIVNASSMSRGGVYKYYSSTDEMYRKIVSRADEQFKGYFNRLAEEHQTILEALNTYLDKALEELRGEGSFGIVIYEYLVIGFRDEEKSDYIVKRGLVNLDKINKLLQRGVDSGEFSPKLPIPSITIYLINVLDGLVLYKLSFGYENARIEDQLTSLKMYLKEVLF